MYRWTYFQNMKYIKNKIKYKTKEYKLELGCRNLNVSVNKIKNIIFNILLENRNRVIIPKFLIFFRLIPKNFKILKDY